jgi:hypothetical protein
MPRPGALSRSADGHGGCSPQHEEDIDAAQGDRRNHLEEVARQDGGGLSALELHVNGTTILQATDGYVPGLSIASACAMASAAGSAAVEYWRVVQCDVNAYIRIVEVC